MMCIAERSIQKGKLEGKKEQPISIAKGYAFKKMLYRKHYALYWFI
ncbi:hypothetical protein ACRRVB_04550 [Candidatus Cardinium hertigii]